MLFDFLSVYIVEFSYLAILSVISVSHILPIPEEAVLIAAGYVASLGFGKLGNFVLVCLLGVLIADNMAYWIGRKKGEIILQIVTDHFHITQARLDKTKQFFQKHSGKSIFLSRFLVGFRLFIPYLAGVLKLPFGKFFFFNLLGAVIWIPIVIYASYWLSGAFDLYAEFTVFKHWIWIAGILIVGFIIGWREFWKG
ncbi:hypothetical protein A2833_02890 [Candidatus Azambacteria bacterium RIFCSPHIGHO2_01_FULL_44_55]|uniref:VTT domain-containing protein n=1 Tax=Candidatus Azambacteria bacterium RIFCSPLOWO2_02_FULL_44_14 TaxID=1797306 RepID=A0A1F5CBZ6_9BACT|nr:MAG: hypothetical protein A3A18_02780 [Candidatus Azambacteria bacterium RIFCSPLOWO2_01_FULL_44_84]OGD33233.1 MAG: hypothetical protein A3C78_03185 [Candidatus Azambacteria bacterium RIFCSPHIGHO2_02_FULL_45_18]OGD40338.1 MAG: hypothetical protein A3I30_03545 [Candidatus Azambacteria bacterium RIFCSPLOWO2_02_FULL_44_14]OGD40701.1 MAG: hypothetical protein A2833_02890 [Candidatus Azambacteria bacterium RIFCSPHIGHO2_01_FULL_44_55]OGD52061.1 MAG: hypothetical protein A2608_01845 [Candidatus Azam